MNRPMSELVKVALGIAVSGSFSLYAIRLMTQHRIRESVTYKEAMECLNSNKEIVDLLGKPIEEKRVDISDNKCYGHDLHTMWVSIPLKGDKNSGNLRYWVTVDDRTASKFRVTKIQFEPNGTEGQTFTLKDDPSPAS